MKRSASQYLGLGVCGLMATLLIPTSSPMARADVDPLAGTHADIYASLYQSVAARAEAPGPKHEEYSTGVGLAPLRRELLQNPERGFDAYDGGCSLTPGELATYRADGITLVRCVFPLPDGRLTGEAEDFRTMAHLARTNGVKLIVRFSYGPFDAWPKDRPYVQPSKERVDEHLQELGPELAKNADVIALVESGFIGAYGEGVEGGTDFGRDLNANKVQLENRKAIVTTLLAHLPSSRMVSV